MDSLFANYASSDEEESEKPSSLPSPSPPKPTSNPKPSSSFLSSLPPPKTTLSSASSIFSALPPPKTQYDQQKETKSSLFSFLPLPKSQPTTSKTEISDPNPKRVVQFTLPINPSMLKTGDLDDDERKPIVKDKSGSTPSKALSSMLPPPRNSLCLAPKKTHVPNPERVKVKQERNDLDLEKTKIEETHFSNPGTIQENQERGEFGDYGHYDATGYGNYDGTADADNGDQGGGSQENQQQSGFENYAHDDGNSYGVGTMGNWKDRSGEAAVVAPEVHEMGRFGRKRGRSNIMPEIVEVNQDELMKNKPRADQAKLTGIAFGPAYQPVSSSKGKPTKLHKRKHQIGSLYFDMKQNETELAERRAKGFLTKSETQAKYGW